MSWMVAPASSMRGEGGFAGEVDRVLVGVPAELGHRSPDDPGVSCHVSLLARATDCAGVLDGGEAEGDGLGAFLVDGHTGTS